MRHEGLLHMVMLAQPTSGLIMIQPDFAFAFFEGRFNRSAPTRQTHQLSLRVTGRHIAQVALKLALLDQAAPHCRLISWPRQLITHTCHPQPRELGSKWSFAVFLDQTSSPLRRGQVRGQLFY